MAQMERPQRRESSKTPNGPTIEQLLREGEGPWWSSTTPSSTSSLGRNHFHDQEEDHGHLHHRKSVLSKVKEKAKKLRRSLSGKKKHNELDENTTPAWGVSSEDYKDKEKDAEYLGAPMYESKLAPDSYKESARQHPRATPVISEKHVLPSVNNNKKENPDVSPTKSTSKPTQIQSHDDKLSSPSQKTITETVSQKLIPPPEIVTATVSEATHSIASKIRGLSLNSSTAEQPSQGSCSAQTSSDAGKNASSGGGQRMFDKGVSVKDYLLNKFEPGDEDRALSRAISDALSPRTGQKAPSDQMSVVDKVREAVTSLLRNDQPQSPPSNPAVLTRSTTKAPSRSSVPISTNAHEVVEEENHGRILQTN